MSFGLDWSTISNVSNCAFYFCYTAAAVVCLCMKLRTHTPWIWSDNRFSFFIFLVTKAKISSSSSSSYYLLYCPLPFRTHTRGAVSMLNTFRLLLVTCQHGAVGCERPWLCVFHSRSIQFLFVKLFNLIRAYDGGVLINFIFSCGEFVVLLFEKGLRRRQQQRKEEQKRRLWPLRVEVAMEERQLYVKWPLT